MINKMLPYESLLNFKFFFFIAIYSDIESNNLSFSLFNLQVVDNRESKIGLF